MKRKISEILAFILIMALFALPHYLVGQIIIILFVLQIILTIFLIHILYCSLSLNI